MPIFKDILSDYDMGLFWSKNYKLPPVNDPDGGKVSVIYAPTNLDFIKFDEGSNTFSFNPIHKKHIGPFSIMVTLIDENNGKTS